MNVLVSPLDWGLGHATRLVPIVRLLLSRGHNVFLAGSGNSLRVLQAEFPMLAVISLPSFSPRFVSGDSQVMRLIAQVPRFIFCKQRERTLTSRIVRSHNIDLIISDNRYGVRSSKCRSYILTHQFRPRVSAGCPAWIERVVARVLAHWISKFNGCLVPDVALDGSGYAGSLSVPTAEVGGVRAVGILTRLTKVPSEDLPPVEFLGIVSGPEPQRTIFEDILRSKFANTGKLCVIVRGCPSDVGSDSRQGNLHLISHCDARRLAGLILSARHIVCRSGYSSVMDLQGLGRRALLVPTPGQAEQEYLADHLRSFGFATTTQQQLAQGGLYQFFTQINQE